MRRWCVTLALLGMLPVAAPVVVAWDDEQPSAKEELKRFQGKWQLFAFEGPKLKIPKVEGDYFLMVKDDVVMWSPWLPDVPKPGLDESFRFTLNPSTKPRTMRFSRTLPSGPLSEPEDIKWDYGYELDGDSLRLVHDSAKPEVLPDSFDTTKGTRWVLTYKRVKRD